MFDFQAVFSESDEPGGRWVRYEETDLECHFLPQGNRRWAAVIACLPEEAQEAFAESERLKLELRDSYDDAKVDRLVEIDARIREWNADVCAKAGWIAWRLLRPANGSGKPTGTDVTVTDGDDVMEPCWKSRKTLMLRHDRLYAWAIGQCALQAIEIARERDASGKGSRKRAASTSSTRRTATGSRSRSGGSRRRKKTAPKPVPSSESSIAASGANGRA